MSRLCLFVYCPHGVHAPEDNYVRTRDLFARFAEISPLFARISPRATRSGMANMLKQPAFPEISFEEWQAAYAAHDKDANRYGDIPSLGVRMPYWNREQHSYFQRIDLKYDVFGACDDNEVRLIDIVPDLVDAGLIPDLMRACIEVFDSPRAESAWLTRGADSRFLYHRLWLKEGVPFPEGVRPPQVGEPIRREKMNRYPAGHPLPDRQETWLGGTLYTWTAHDPRRLLAEERGAVDP